MASLGLILTLLLLTLKLAAVGPIEWWWVPVPLLVEAVLGVVGVNTWRR